MNFLMDSGWILSVVSRYQLVKIGAFSSLRNYQCFHVGENLRKNLQPEWISYFRSRYEKITTSLKFKRNHCYVFDLVVQLKTSSSKKSIFTALTITCHYYSSPNAKRLWFWSPSASSQWPRWNRTCSDHRNIKQKNHNYYYEQRAVVVSKIQATTTTATKLSQLQSFLDHFSIESRRPAILVPSRVYCVLVCK